MSSATLDWTHLHKLSDSHIAYTTTLAKSAIARFNCLQGRAEQDILRLTAADTCLASRTSDIVHYSEHLGHSYGLAAV